MGLAPHHSLSHLRKKLSPFASSGLTQSLKKGEGGGRGGHGLLSRLTVPWGTTAAMEIHRLGRLCLLVTALISLDLHTKFSQFCVTFDSAKSVSYIFKLLRERSEAGSSHFAQFVVGIALLVAFSAGLRILKFSFRPKSHLKNGVSVNSDIRDPMERPSSAFENGHLIVNGDARSVDGSSSECSDSEGSCGEEQVFDEMLLREFSQSIDFCGPMELSRRPSSPIESGHSVSNGSYQSIMDSEDSESEELFPGNRQSDVILLRELVKKERQRAKAALAELNKERSAATTAAEEAMSMILRLQQEKSSIEIEANQYRRLAEERHRHDREVIGYLRNVIAEQEIDLNGLEEDLRLCRRSSSLPIQYCNCSDGTDDFEDGAEENIHRTPERRGYTM